jgi:uncharacterized membrane protein
VKLSENWMWVFLCIASFVVGQLVGQAGAILKTSQLEFQLILTEDRLRKAESCIQVMRKTQASPFGQQDGIELLRDLPINY